MNNNETCIDDGAGKVWLVFWLFVFFVQQLISSTNNYFSITFFKYHSTMKNELLANGEIVVKTN
jgi:hypothetical protein